jgi:hypothetical protein
VSSALADLTLRREEMKVRLVPELDRGFRLGRRFVADPRGFNEPGSSRRSAAATCDRTSSSDGPVDAFGVVEGLRLVAALFFGAVPRFPFFAVAMYSICRLSAKRVAAQRGD